MERSSPEVSISSANESGIVSARFLTDFFRALESSGLPAVELVGDLPLPALDADDPPNDVDWSVFVEFLRRLELQVEGPEGLEACGELICDLKPAQVLRGLAGLTASPLRLYRAAVSWALRRALPGIQTRIRPIDHNHIEIRARLVDGLRACPQIFHFAAGGARALPRILDLPDAIVTAEIKDCEAIYQIELPPSATLFARIRRFARSIFSVGSVLEFLERQQLELNTQHEALRKNNAALADSERRYRALTDAALDVICEIDENGRIVYVSASVHDLLGYRPEQVIGSHFRLWVPTRFHGVVNARFEAIHCQQTGGTVPRELVTLHANHGVKIVAEGSARSYHTPAGEWRLVLILRDVTDRVREALDGLLANEPQPAGSSLSEIHTDLARLHADDRHKPWALRGEQDDAPHPTGQSLSVLLRALETHLAASEDPALQELTEATGRMSQIVDDALLLTQDDAEERKPFEVAKLIDAAAAEFASEADGDDYELRAQISDREACSEVLCHPEILTAGLVSLLDHARKRLMLPGTIDLLAEATQRGSENEPWVRFRVVGRVLGHSEIARDHLRAFDPDLAQVGDLDLAVAFDVALAHSGALEVAQGPEGATLIHLELPLFGNES